MRQRDKSVLAVMLLDMLFVSAAGLIALLVHAEFLPSRISAVELNAWLRFLPFQLILTIIVFALARMYQYIWSSVSVKDVLKMAVTVLGASVLCAAAAYLLRVQWPKSVQFVALFSEMALVIGLRCTTRFFHALRGEKRPHSGEEGAHIPQIMLIGAGEAGRILIRETLTSARVSGNVRCIIDDNVQKRGKFLHGIPVVGGRDSIQAAVEKYRIDQIIFAIPTASTEDRQAILNICKTTSCKVKILPGIFQLVNGEVSMAAVKDVEVEDLLGREPVKLDLDVLNNFLGNKVVLVTGGGGSIGSELCRQIARYRPRQLIILDIYENNAYDIQQELLRSYGSALNLRVEIASVRDKEKVYRLFDTLRPDVVFHAAAHKHVPLMESCPEEAIKNNVFGTWHVVRAAEKYGVSKFIMISTDKAVNPTNFMGATKRFCEMILQSRFNSRTEFAAVRFGNVLGSNGSVVPLFKQQIANGGPVTVTDKRIIRYFMTIPEAASLVLEAGAMARRGQIFVLDMGDPVKILTLAENLIQLSGLCPYEDVDIVEVGLRPGEKLYEELLIKSSDLSKTSNQKIFVEQQQYISPDLIMDDLHRLDDAITADDESQDLIALMMQMVPSYRSPEEINSRAAELLEGQGREEAKGTEEHKQFSSDFAGFSPLGL